MSIHGIAIANQVNIKMLRSWFEIDIIEEYSRLEEHDKISLHKFINLLKNNLSIISKAFIHRYDYFYLVFSLSTFGCIKTLIAIINFRIFNRGKIVLHIHRGDFFTRFYNTFTNRTITKLIFILTNKIVVLSDNHKTEFETFFKRPINVLFNTVELEYAETLKKTQKNHFVFISNYLIDKGIIDLLEVFKKLTTQNQKIYLQTYGAFADQSLKEKILKYNSSNISINGAITGDLKFKKISESKCLILPSWNEGQPLIILEAMSVGTPIIVSKVGLIPELLGNDYPYYTIPGDRNSLEMNILRFIKETNITDISVRIKSRYTRNYSQKKHEERLWDIFSVK